MPPGNGQVLHELIAIPQIVERLCVLETLLCVGRQVAIGVRFAAAGRLGDGCLVSDFQGIDVPLRQWMLHFVSIRVGRLAW